MAVGRPRRWIDVAVLLCLALLHACADQAGDPLDETFDGRWILAEGTGPEGTIELDVGLEDPARVTLRIDGDEWTGVAACNSYGGTASVEDGTITGELGFVRTEMACDPPELMTIESDYLAALQIVERGEVVTATEAADALTLTGPETVLRFTREPEGEPDSADVQAIPAR